MEGEIFVSVTYFYYLCTCLWYTKGEREGGREGEGEMLYKAMYEYTKFGRRKEEREGGKALMIHVLFKALWLANSVICFIVYNIQQRK